MADILLLVGFIALYRSITEGVSATLARLGIVVAVVAEGIYGVNQAVDGSQSSSSPNSVGWAAIVLGAIEVGYSLDLARNGFAGSPLGMASLFIAPWNLVLAVNLWRKAGG